MYPVKRGKIEDWDHMEQVPRANFTFITYQPKSVM